MTISKRGLTFKTKSEALDKELTEARKEIAEIKVIGILILFGAWVGGGVS